MNVVDSVIILKILFVSVFLFWTLYNLPAFFVGLKRYAKIGKRRNADDPPDDYQPKVSIIVPVKNEENVIERLLKALINLSYPKKEIILVEDGSTDKTRQICKRYAENHPSLIKIYHKNPSHGKPSAINYAAKRVTGEIIAVYDADTVIEPDVLERIVPHFQDPETVAVQGEIYTLNPDENLITKLSVLTDFLVHVQQLGKEGLGLFVTCLGTHTYVRRKVLEELGYWDPKSLGEDLELSVRLTKRGYRVKYVPIRAGVEAPTKLGTFVRQRLRWFRGYIQATRKHLNLLKSLNRKSFDAQLTLLLPMMLTLSLLGYVFVIYGAINPMATSQIEQTIGTALLLLSLSTPVAMVVANPKIVIYAPLIYLNWVLMASISTLAHLHALLRKPLEWTKTEKTGKMVSRTMMSEKKSITVADMVSIIIPAYNEASGLRQNIRSIREAIEPVTRSCQIIIAEDGSTDGTNIITEELAEENPWILHLHSDKRLGKGCALKRALRASRRGEVIVFMDADLATSLDYLSRIMEPIKNGYDGAIGSRNIKEACVKRPLSRAVASMAYNLFVRLLFRDGIRDHQCGFKAFRRQALESLINDVKSDGFLFDTELIVKAKRKGFLIDEVPVTWREPEGRNSRVLLFRDGVRMGLELLKLRVKLWRR